MSRKVDYPSYRRHPCDLRPVRPGSFVAPAPRSAAVPLSTPTDMKMSLESFADIMPAVPAEAHNQLVELSNNLLLASSPSDFGGYTGPVIGLLTIGAIILVLSPPLAD
ncbi:unnamed protein product [Discosporangium mesarthrocarpum]